MLAFRGPTPPRAVLMPGLPLTASVRRLPGLAAGLQLLGLVSLDWGDATSDPRRGGRRRHRVVADLVGCAFKEVPDGIGEVPRAVPKDVVVEEDKLCLTSALALVSAVRWGLCGGQRWWWRKGCWSSGTCSNRGGRACMSIPLWLHGDAQDTAQWLQQRVLCVHVVDDGGFRRLSPLGFKFFGAVLGFWPSVVEECC